MMKQILAAFAFTACSASAAHATEVTLEEARQIGFMNAAVEYCEGTGYPLKWVDSIDSVAMSAGFSDPSLDDAFNKGGQQFLDGWSDETAIGSCMGVDLAQSSIVKAN